MEGDDGGGQEGCTLSWSAEVIRNEGFVTAKK